MLIEYTKNGRRRAVNAKVAKFLIDRNLARAVEEGKQAEVLANSSSAEQAYQTRMLQAAPVANADAAPYGYKSDGTPRKRPAPQRATKAQD